MVPDRTSADRGPDAETRILPTRLSLHPEAFIASTAVLRGDVTVGRRSSVWYNAVLRGDLAPIVIGEQTNVQDGAILHVEIDHPAMLGDRVTVGHMALVHAATVEDECLVAMGAMVLSGATVGRQSIIGAGALVKEGFQVPPRSLVMGVPGKIVRSVTEEDLRRVMRNWQVYVAYAEQYRLAGAS